jgi:hypothetical protein
VLSPILAEVAHTRTPSRRDQLTAVEKSKVVHGEVQFEDGQALLKASGARALAQASSLWAWRVSLPAGLKSTAKMPVVPPAKLTVLRRQKNNPAIADAIRDRPSGRQLESPLRKLLVQTGVCDARHL